MYNKLFTKILDSSIWLEPLATRVVWITILAAMDRDCIAHFAATANLARRAGVTEEEAEKAVACFLAPDPNSSDPDFEGRRVERIPGGFYVLNGKKYQGIFNREIQREHTRLRVEKYREKKRADVTRGNAPVTPCNADVTHGVTDVTLPVTRGNAPVTPCNADVTHGVTDVTLPVTRGNAPVTHTYTDPDTNTDANADSSQGYPNAHISIDRCVVDTTRHEAVEAKLAIAAPETPAGGVLFPREGGDSGQEVKTRQNGFTEAAKGILDHLNQQAGRSFRGIAQNLDMIAKRLAEVNGDVDGVTAMLNRQIALWKTDDKMSAFLRPATLFNKTKFHQYYDDRHLPATPTNGSSRSRSPGEDRNQWIGGGDEFDKYAAARIAEMENRSSVPG